MWVMWHRAVAVDWLTGLLLGGHVGHQVADTVAVAELIVVPCDQLDKVVVEGDASASIKDGGANVAIEVCGDNLVLCVSQNALHGSISSGYSRLCYVVVFGRFLQTDCQVDH